MKFKVGLTGEEIDKNISYDFVPEVAYQENLWCHIAFINDENLYIKAICSTYSNKKYPPGSIVVSNKIFNDFPIAQSAWGINGKISRMYVDPYYRGKKIAVYSVTMNDMIASFLNETIWSRIYDEKGGTVAGDQLYNSMYNLGFENKKVEIDMNDIFQYRNFSHPINYIDKRVVYVESDIQQD